MGSSPASARESVRRSSTRCCRCCTSTCMASKRAGVGLNVPSRRPSIYARMTVSGVRSSWAMSAVICRRRTLARARSALSWLKASVSVPNSSAERTGTSCLSSPAAMAWMAWVRSRRGRVRVRASRTPEQHGDGSGPKQPVRGPGWYWPGTPTLADSRWALGPRRSRSRPCDRPRRPVLARAKASGGMRWPTAKGRAGVITTPFWSASTNCGGRGGSPGFGGALNWRR